MIAILVAIVFVIALYLDGLDLDKATLPRIGSMKSLSTDSQPKTPSKAKRNSIDAGNSKVSHEGSTGSEVIWLRKNSTCSDIFSLFSTSSDHLDTNRFYRKIAGVARRSIVDLQVSTLLEIDFSCRLINLGEKEMLERGLSLQKAGDLEAAVIYYARAGAHSKDPQISRMLIGNVEYSRNKLLSALRYYGLAVSIIESKPPALRPLQDAFIGYYNRAVIHFRLGDDEEGLKDLEQAVIIDPKHMQARELLSLVKRRLGKYNQAIEDAIISKNYKVEMKRKEQQQQAKAKEDAEDPSNAATATSKSTYLNVLDEGCRSSLKERVQEAKLNIRQDDDDDTDAHIGGGYLKMFKMQNNFKMELFDELFHRPTDMQGALLTVPSDRTPQQLETIANLLSFFVPFQSLTRSTLQELATVIEYRAISNQEMLTQNNKLFRQNSDPYAVCMLVKGSIYSHLDYFTQQSMSNIPLDEYTSYEVFGHIDYLFHSMTKSLVKVVEEVFALKHKLKAFKDDGESISSEDDFESDGDQDDGFEKKLDVHDQAKASAFKQLMSELQSLILEATTNTASKLPTAITGKLHRQSTIQTATNTMASASHMNSISRAIRPGMFATYTLQQPSELLVLSSADYYKYMFAPALDELKLRLETLKSSGLFSSWRPEEIIRLARMARVEKKNRGARILNQGQKPNHLYLIMRGICKVLKKPNRTEMLVHKLEVAREKAYQHDLKYVFHHKPIEFSFDNMFSSMGSEEGQEGVEGEVGEVSVVTGEGSHSKGITSHGKGSSHTRDVPTTPQVKPSIHHEKNVASSHPVAHTPTAGHRLSQPHPHTPFTPTHHSKLHASTPNTPTRSPHNRHHLTVVITPTGDRIAHTPKHDKNTPKSITTPKHGAHSQPFSTLQPLHLPPSTPSIVRSKSCATPKGISTPKGIRKPENLKAFKGLKDVYAFPTTVEQAARKLTSPERERQELADEIIKLEELISQARVQDALDTTIGSASKSFDVQESPIANARPFSSGRSFSFKKPDKEAQEIGKALGAKEAEIATLQWPRIFGEASVLDPDQGVSRGSVVADTSVEVLVIHKKQIQTFQIDDTFLDRVKAKALVYPGDPDIVVSLYRKNEWSDYRKEVMKGISTTRWPKSLVAHEPFSV
ncbi:hypothetical protein EON65_12880 [archaeon]|nr:MAG: hypothetical protein EON65_12880 [archaeon]